MADERFGGTRFLMKTKIHGQARADQQDKVQQTLLQRQIETWHQEQVQRIREELAERDGERKT